MDQGMGDAPVYSGDLGYGFGVFSRFKGLGCVVPVLLLTACCLFAMLKASDSGIRASDSSFRFRAPRLLVHLNTLVRKFKHGEDNVAARYFEHKSHVLIT